MSRSVGVADLQNGVPQGLEPQDWRRVTKAMVLSGATDVGGEKDRMQGRQETEEVPKMLFASDLNRFEQSVVDHEQRGRLR